MDAVEFIKIRDRMMRVKGQAPNVEYGRSRSAEEVVSIVEQWAKEHPIKTRQSVFLEMFADAKLDKEGHINLCPVALTNEKCGLFGKPYECCCDCRREFWMQEVE